MNHNKFRLRLFRRFNYTQTKKNKLTIIILKVFKYCFRILSILNKMNTNLINVSFCFVKCTYPLLIYKDHYNETLILTLRLF